MSFFDEWKKAKEDFEEAIGKKEPSKKFLENFRKFSGLERALKELDDAVSKENITLAARAMEDYKKSFRTYISALEKAASQEKFNIKKELGELESVLNNLNKLAADGLRKLKELKEKESQATEMEEIFTVAEAIDKEGVEALSLRKWLSDKDLAAWFSNDDAKVVEINGRRLEAPKSKEYLAEAQARFARIVKLHIDFIKEVKNKNRPLNLDSVRKIFFDFFLESQKLFPDLKSQIDNWACSQQFEIVTEVKEGGAAEKAFQEWRKRSSAWEQASNFKDLWENEEQFLKAFTNVSRTRF